MKPLLAPVRLGSLELKNGFIVAPMTTYSSRDDGIIADDEIPYLARRAEGGFAAVMTAACYVHPSGKAFSGQWGCDADDKLDSLRRVADAIHEKGSKAILQIHHGGRQCPPELAGGECLSASAVASEREGAPTPREMTDAQIVRTLGDYARAAVRAKETGYDAVEIHGANTYLIQQFVSPHSNRRTDRWRADDFLFPTELVRQVLDAVGDFPVGYRFSPEEPETPGIRLERTFELVDRLCGLSLSFLHLSLRSYDQLSLHGHGDQPILRQVSDRIAGRLPLVGVGSVKSAEDVAKAVDLGCDALAIARGAIYDPDWVAHYAAEKPISKTLVRESFSEDVVLPRGLTERILKVPGWFDFAD
ncbi:MAG: tRNA-dihydrouridine synthase [Armatimonadetes bacterium]|nr:tRNA-dihydrouridine synthase [Armatimonadota bacterium]